MAGKRADRVGFAVAFGKRIRAARTVAELSLSGVREVAGIPKGMMNNLENGRREPSTWTVHQLALAFGCSPGDLFPTLEEIDAETV